MDANGGRYQGYRTHYKWDAGLTLRDWRYVVRIANIDVSELGDAGTTPAAILKLMARALHRVPNLKLGRAAFYMNRTIAEALDVQSMSNSALALKLRSWKASSGKPSIGIPLRTTDALLTPKMP